MTFFAASSLGDSFRFLIDFQITLFNDLIALRLDTVILVTLKNSIQTAYICSSSPLYLNECRFSLM